MSAVASPSSRLRDRSVRARCARRACRRRSSGVLPFAGFANDRGRPRKTGGRPHPRQHWGIDAVGLGARADGLREAAGPRGSDLDQIMTGRAPNVLQVAMIAPCRLLDDPDRRLGDPTAQGGQPRRVVWLPNRSCLRSERRWMSNMSLEMSIPMASCIALRSLCLSSGARARLLHVCVQVMRKAGAIQLLTGPTDHRSSGPPPPLGGMCELSQSGSRIAQEPRDFLG